MDNERKVEVAARSGKKTALVVICVLAVLVLGVAGFAGIYLNSMFNSINHVEIASPVVTEPAEVAVQEETTAPTEEAGPAYADKDAENYLVVCKPVRDGKVKKTDTMILCSLNRKTKTMTMTTLQPEAMVKTPAYKKYEGGEAALNTVYGMGSTYGKGTVGSMEFMNQTLYDNFGIVIDKNFEIDMKLFSLIISRIGNVTIDVSAEEAAYLSTAMKKDITSGEQEMDSKMAQAYVNMWGDEEAEGINVTNSQKKLVKAILAKISSQYVVELESIVKSIMPTITTTMDFKEFRDFLISILPMIKTLTIENGGTLPAA